MSWTADIIYTIPNQNIIKELKETPHFLNEYNIYLVNDLRGIRSEWSKKFMLLDTEEENKHLKHDLPERGILAIIPKEYKSGYQNDYSKYEFWNRYEKTKPRKRLSSLIDKLKQELVYEIGDNQIKLFQFLQKIYNKHELPIINYRCDYWGGSVEFEFSLEFNRENTLCVHDNEKSILISKSDTSKSNKTVLQNSLKALNLELPSNFFALHERSFDWSKYKI